MVLIQEIYNNRDINKIEKMINMEMFLSYAVASIGSILVMSIISFILKSLSLLISKKCTRVLDGVEFNSWECTIIQKIKNHVDKKGLQSFDIRIPSAKDIVDSDKIIKYINNHDEFNFNVKSINHSVNRYNTHTEHQTVHHTEQIYYVEVCKRGE